MYKAQMFLASATFIRTGQSGRTNDDLIIILAVLMGGSAREMFSHRDAEIAEIKKIEKSSCFIPSNKEYSKAF